MKTWKTLSFFKIFQWSHVCQETSLSGKSLNIRDMFQIMFVMCCYPDLSKDSLRSQHRLIITLIVCLYFSQSVSEILGAKEIHYDFAYVLCFIYSQLSVVLKGAIISVPTVYLGITKVYKYPVPVLNCSLYFGENIYTR